VSDLSWDVRDILSAPRRALDCSSMLVGTVAIVVAAVALTVSTYLGILVDGRFPVGYVWARLHAFPWVYHVNLGPGGSCVQALGLVAAIVTVVYALVAICKTAYRRLKGDHRFGATEAWRFARRRGHAVIALICVLLTGTVSVVAAGLLASYAARLPWIGELLLAVAIIPGVPLSVGVILLLVASVGTLLMGPAVVGTLEDDWLDVLVQVGSLMWARWWRWLLYESVLGVVTAVAGCIAFAVLAAALGIVVSLGGAFAPDKMLGMMLAAASYVPGLGFVVFPFMRARGVVEYSITPSVWAAGVIFASALTLYSALVLGYVLSVWATGQTLVYVILRRLHLGQNVLERDDDIDRLAALAHRTNEPAPAQAPPVAPEGEREGEGLSQIEGRREEPT